MGKYFGTDGIRGVANLELTAELAYKAGRALGFSLREKEAPKVFVGRDTRRSGTLLEDAFSAGLQTMGVDVWSLGILPTPGVAYLTRLHRASAGVVISASHNPGEYNGIKIFSTDGFKWTDEEEELLERRMDDGVDIHLNGIGESVGVRTHASDVQGEYLEHLLRIYRTNLSGYKVALDCGSGALYELAPTLFRKLGADVVAVNTDFDGMDINKGTGSTNPEVISKLVLDSGADVGFSFDGDGDRVISVDELGKVMDGDHYLAACGSHLYREGKLNGGAVVGTVMTNMGLDLFFRDLNIEVKKTKVGDRYILEEMRKNGFNFGGEQSGHIIFLDHNTTGDGLAAAAYLMKVMKETGDKMSALNSLMSNVPQFLVNARVKNENKKKFAENEEIAFEIDKIEKKFNGRGRVVIRPSGTEPLVRIMIEANTDEDIYGIATELSKFIEERLG